MQASVEERLHSLELTIEALSRRMDSFVGQRQIISHQNLSNLEESTHQLSRTRPRLQPIQNSLPQPAHSNPAIRPSPSQQAIYSFQPVQPSSSTALNSPQINDPAYSAQQAYQHRPINPQSVYPHGQFVPQHYVPVYAPEIAADNKWQCWSCCMLWLGLIMLLGGIGLVISGSILLAQYFNSLCQSPYVRYGGQCCYASTCKITNYTSYTVPVIFLCFGFVSGVTGICFLVRAYKVYRNNSSTCC